MGMAERVKTLESKLFVDADDLPEGVFCYPIDGRKGTPDAPLPVKGWKYNDHRIMRAAGESDDELAHRAFSEVKPFLGKSVVPVFHSIGEATANGVSET